MLSTRSRFNDSAVQRFSVSDFFLRQRGEHIARWGQAELVRHLDGRYELRGGTPDDRQAAREWISMFCHEALVAA